MCYFCSFYCGREFPTTERQNTSPTSPACEAGLSDRAFCPESTAPLSFRKWLITEHSQNVAQVISETPTSTNWLRFLGVRVWIAARIEFLIETNIIPSFLQVPNFTSFCLELLRYVCLKIYITATAETGITLLAVSWTYEIAAKCIDNNTTYHLPALWAIFISRAFQSTNTTVLSTNSPGRQAPTMLINSPRGSSYRPHAQFQSFSLPSYSLVKYLSL